MPVRLLPRRCSPSSAARAAGPPPSTSPSISPSRLPIPSSPASPLTRAAPASARRRVRPRSDGVPARTPALPLLPPAWRAYLRRRTTMARGTPTIEAARVGLCDRNLARLRIWCLFSWIRPSSRLSLLSLFLSRLFPAMMGEARRSSASSPDAAHSALWFASPLLDWLRTYMCYLGKSRGFICSLPLGWTIL